MDDKRSEIFGLLAVALNKVPQARLHEVVVSADAGHDVQHLLVASGDLSVGDAVTLDRLVDSVLKQHGDDADKAIHLLRTKPGYAQELTKSAATGVFGPGMSGNTGNAEQAALRETEEAGEYECRPGDQIGPYTLLSVLGEGGFGIVYLAEQHEPVRRQVALKIIKPGMDTKQVIARFEAERQALALLDHPNVARVFDGGATKAGRTYFVMEHVDGVPITDYCDHHKLSIEERLSVFLHVCGAVQHAHQKGIIHRDIKPSNILVTMDGEKPEPKIIDFGIAKAIVQPLTERTLHTQQGQAVGTLEYMSPEQAGMTNQDVDTRSDIYSLGVVFYELLTGVLPFEAETLRTGGSDHIRNVIQQVEARAPSARLSTLENERAVLLAQYRSADHRTLRRMLRGDLDWITLKALEKDRTRRYASAAELAADIKRHLANEPVLAGPPGAVYRMRKFVRRNRALVVGTAAVLVVLVGGIAASTTLAIGQFRAHMAADIAQEEAERQAEIAGQQRKHAEQEHERAEANYRLARAALDEAFANVGMNVLLTMPEMQPLRRKLLQSLLKYYQQFSATRQDDLGVRIDLAYTQFSVALILLDLNEPGWVDAIDTGLDMLESLIEDDVPEALLLEQAHPIYRPEVEFSNDAIAAGMARPLDMARIFARLVPLLEDCVHKRPNVLPFKSDLAMLYHANAEAKTALLGPEASIPQFKKALALWEELISIDPQDATFHAGYAVSIRRLGKCYERVGSTEEMLAAMQATSDAVRRTVELRPDVPRYRDLKGNYTACYAEVLSNLGRFDEALAQYNIAINVLDAVVKDYPGIDKYKGGCASQHSNRGYVHLRRGDLALAVADYDIAVDMTHEPAYELRVIVRALLDYEELSLEEARIAHTYAQQLCDLEASNPEAWEMLAYTSYRTGEYQAAADALSQALTLGLKDNGQSLLYNAMIQWRLDNTGISRQHLTAAAKWVKTNDPDNQSLHRLQAEARSLIGK